MRDVLFKAKSYESKEWVHGSLIAMDDNASGQVFIFPPVRGASIIPCGILVASGMIAVDSETICQYTGLKDKNGTDIFEGDIVVLHGSCLPWWRSNGEKAVVKYARFGFEPFCGYQVDLGRFINAAECEVIGNIYDNPELAEVN